MSCGVGLLRSVPPGLMVRCVNELWASGVKHGVGGETTEVRSWQGIPELSVSRIRLRHALKMPSSQCR